MVSWGEEDQDGAHGLQLVLCPQPGAASGCGGGKAKPKAVCSGKCEPELSPRLLALPWLPGGLLASSATVGVAGVHGALKVLQKHKRVGQWFLFIAK